MNRHDIGLAIAGILTFVVPCLLAPFNCAIALVSMIVGFVVWAWTFDPAILLYNPLRLLHVFTQRLVVTASSVALLVYAGVVGCGWSR